VEVTPLELKLTIEDQIAREEAKVDYDKENECCLCYCTLYDNLKEVSLQKLIEEQRSILSKKLQGSPDSEL